MGDREGACRRQGVTYSILGITCQEERKTRQVVAAYKGETGRNASDRGKKHLAALRKKSEDSVLWLHSLLHQEDINFQMVAKQAYSEPLERPLREKINIHKL